MKARKFIPILLLVLAVVLALQYLFFQNRSVKGPPLIRISGNIEIIDAEVSFRIPGKLDERLVDEGQAIKNGQIVARLEATELRREVALRQAEIQAAQAVLAELLAGSRPEEINQAEASVRRAQARLKELLAGSRPQEVAAVEAEVTRAQADAERLRTEHDRQKALFQKEIISPREYDSAQTAYAMAAAKVQEIQERLKLVKEGPRQEEIEQARAALQEVSERHTLLKIGPRRETIDQARARLRQAQEALALSETRLGYTTLFSPLSGWVLSKNAEPGEYLAPGTPVVTVGDLTKVWLRAYINESDLGRVKVGQRVRVTTDTFPGRVYAGSISFISPQAEFTPKNVQTEKERVKLVYRVKVDIPNPEIELKPGMPADAEIQLDE